MGYIWAHLPLRNSNLSTVPCTAVAMIRVWKMARYTMVVSGERLGKHVPAATDTNATMVQQQKNRIFCGSRRADLSANESRHNNRRAVFLMWSEPRCYKQGTRLQLSQSCTIVCKDRTWAREAEESPLLEAVVRERLVKTVQAGEDLACNNL
jgi:hypothetical protein